MDRHEIDPSQCDDDASKEFALVARRLGRRIQLLRVEAGLSQFDLAEGLGICREMLARYERGLNCPRLCIVLRLCVLLSVSPDQLLSDLMPTAGPSLPPGRRQTPRRAAAAARLASEGFRG